MIKAIARKNQENRLRELSSKLYAKIEQIDGELGRYDKGVDEKDYARLAVEFCRVVKAITKVSGLHLDGIFYSAQNLEARYRSLIDDG